MPAWWSAVDEQPEAVGVAEARVRGEVRRDVVAPRAAERVLHHRHQLDVGEAEVGDVAGPARRPAGPRSGPAVPLAPRARGAPRRPTSARATGCLPAARAIHASSPHCRSTRRPRATSPAAPRRRRPSGRPSRATRRRRRGSRTCSRRPLPTPGTNSSQTPGRAELAHRVLAAVPAVEVALEPDAARAAAPRPRTTCR